MALFSRKQTPNAQIKADQNADKSGSSISANPRFNQRQSALLKQAWITEKAAAMSGDRKYMFIVANHANKSEVKKAVQSAYGVKVQDVNMIVRKGKTKRLGRSAGRTPDYKKAMVTLKEGQKIEALTP